MTTATVESPATTVVARLADAVDELLGLDLTALTSAELVELLRGVEAQRRRLPVHDHRLVAEFDERGVAGEFCCRDTAALLRDALRLSPGQARARCAAAVELGPRRTVTGERLPPLFPAVARAQAAGVISPARARVIAATIDRMPAEVEMAHGRDVEQRLVIEAARFDPGRLAKLADRILAHLDPDGRLDDDADVERRRHAVLRENRDGSGELRAHLSPACLASWQAVLDPLAAPRPSDVDGPDPRTPGQRLHDALHEAASRLLSAGTLPDTGGTPATVLLTLTADQARTRSGHANTGHGGHLPVTDALHLACEADIIPVIRDARGGILGYGRTRRVASPGQRAALASRDGGCCFPGCDHPPNWCQAHHVLGWADGGRTDVDNLVLLCGFHHRHFERRGWRVRMRDAVPEWIPPPHIDPDRTPVRNTMHDHDLMVPT